MLQKSTGDTMSLKFNLKAGKDERLQETSNRETSRSSLNILKRNSNREKCQKSYGMLSSRLEENLIKV